MTATLPRSAGTHEPRRQRRNGIVLRDVAKYRAGTPACVLLCDDALVADQARRPFYVRTGNPSNYGITRFNAVFFAGLGTVLTVVLIVLLAVRPSLRASGWFAVVCFTGLSWLLAAQNAATAFWLRQHTDVKKPT